MTIEFILLPHATHSYLSHYPTIAVWPWHPSCLMADTGGKEARKTKAERARAAQLQLRLLARHQCVTVRRRRGCAHRTESSRNRGRTGAKEIESARGGMKEEWDARHQLPTGWTDRRKHSSSKLARVGLAQVRPDNDCYYHDEQAI